MNIHTPVSKKCYERFCPIIPLSLLVTTLQPCHTFFSSFKSLPFLPPICCSLYSKYSSGSSHGQQPILLLITTCQDISSLCPIMTISLLSQHPCFFLHDIYQIYNVSYQPTGIHASSLLNEPDFVQVTMILYIHVLQRMLALAQPRSESGLVLPDHGNSILLPVINEEGMGDPVLINGM